MPSNWCVFLLYGRPYPFAGERSFQLLSVIDPLTTDAVSLQFMDGMPAQKAFDMAEATCGKQLLSNTKAGSGGSAGGQARHRPQGELALIVKWVHHIRGMKGWSRISEHQDRVNFLASIQGGWENLLPAPPAPQAMAQPLTGHVTAAERHSGCSGNSRISPGHTARTQANSFGKALRQ